MELKEIESNSPGKRFWFQIKEGDDTIGKIETEYSNWYEPRAYVIYKLIIESNYRRKGYGTKCIKHFIEIAKSEKCARVMAKIHPLDESVTEKNLVEFYKSCNFQLEKINNDLFAVYELHHYREKY